MPNQTNKDEFEELHNRIDNVKKVYDKYKHLDHLFSDKEWLRNDDEELGEVGMILPFKQTFYDLWEAVKEHSKRPNPTQDELVKALENIMSELKGYSNNTFGNNAYKIAKKALLTIKKEGTV